MERRLAINRYVSQNRRWEIGDIVTIELRPSTKIAAYHKLIYTRLNTWYMKSDSFAPYYYAIVYMNLGKVFSASITSIEIASCGSSLFC